MKIAYFINQYPRVSHSFIRREILALEKRGFKVQRIALHGWKEQLPDPEDRAEREQTRYVLQQGAWSLLLPALIVMLRSPRRFLMAMRLALSMVRETERPLPYHAAYLAEACRVLCWLEASGATHLHAHFGSNSTEVAMLVHALGGPPYSFTIHGPHEFETPMGLREKIHRAAFVVAISSFGRSQLYFRSHSSDWPKIKVVHCGLEREFYDVPPIPVPELPRLVCVGRLCTAKGQLLLLEAAARLLAREIPFELVLAGDGEMRGVLEHSIQRLGLSSRVRMTGWISSSEVREEILAARALILPSFAEGLPVVIMEAMALRRPVITTCIAGIPELVQAGQTGWLLPAGCVDELATAMEECLATPVQALQAMGDRGHARVLLRHSIDTEAEKLAALFASATGTMNAHVNSSSSVEHVPRHATSGRGE